MTRIIPGVQVTVIKEVVPRQLAPAGVLGLVGLVAPARSAEPRQAVERIGTWARFRERFGNASALAMPEARSALQNGVFELVIVDVQSSVATAASTTFKLGETDFLGFACRAKGSLANGLELTLTALKSQGRVGGYELRLRADGEDLEVYRNLSPLPGNPKWIGRALAAADSIVQVAPPPFRVNDYTTPTTLAPGDTTDVILLGGGEQAIPICSLKVEDDEASPPLRLQAKDGTLTLTLDPEGNPEVLLSAAVGDPELAQRLSEAAQAADGVGVDLHIPEIALTQPLANGQDASVAEYIDAVDKLVDVPDVDLVAAAVQDLTAERGAAVYGAIIAHCETMSAEAKGRIGFGQVPPGGTPEGHADMLGTLVNDRFVLFAPHGVLGAAVGRIGSLDYYRSPTFKTVAGLDPSTPSLTVAQQRQYLRTNIVPVATLLGRGNVIVRGLTTDGDQISVRRVADRAVRGVKQIGELFIGKLNTEDGRNALRQKISEFLLQMQADNAIVPSTDGQDPAFKLDVYSSQADFALGIVRVDVAVRPVRAIDFIYATILVQV